MPQKSVDITKNIQRIDSLKNRLLLDISELFLVMSGELGTGDSPAPSTADILADLVIASYLLADKTGYAYDLIDIKILQQIKMTLINDGDKDFHDALLSLSRHIGDKHPPKR